MSRVALCCVGIGVVMLVVEVFKSPQSSQERPCFYVQANMLNVRQSPNLQSQILQTLPKGTQVCTYFGVENGFLQLDFGYVAVEFLSLSQQESPKLSSREVVVKEEQSHKESSAQRILLTSTQQQTPLQRARLAIENQDYGSAKQLALKINQENPKNLESWEIFIRALYLEGNKNEAVLVLQKVLDKYPDKALLELLENIHKERI